MDGMKKCSACGEELPRTAFSVRRASGDGLMPQCKKCRIAYYQKRKATQASLDPAATKVCLSCGTRKPLTEFSLHPVGLFGRQSRCLECLAVARRVRCSATKEAIEEERQRKRLYGARSRSKRKAMNLPAPTTRERDRAHAAVRYAVKTGKIAPAIGCELCGHDFEIHPRQAHHYMGYADTHKLDVQWLCAPCHAKADGKTQYALDAVLRAWEEGE